MSAIHSGTKNFWGKIIQSGSNGERGRSEAKVKELKRRVGGQVCLLFHELMIPRRLFFGLFLGVFSVNNKLIEYLLMINPSCQVPTIFQSVTEDKLISLFSSRLHLVVLQQIQSHILYSA